MSCEAPRRRLTACHVDSGDNDDNGNLAGARSVPFTGSTPVRAVLNVVSAFKCVSRIYSFQIVFNRMQCSMFSDRMVRSDELLAWCFDVFCCCLLSCCVQNASRVVWKQHALSTRGCHGAYDLLPVWPCAPQQELYDNKQQGQQFHSNSHFEKKFWPKDREAEGPARIEREAQESRCHVIIVPCFFWIATFYAMHSKATNWTSDMIGLHLFSSEKHPVSSVWLPVACILMYSILIHFYSP